MDEIEEKLTTKAGPLAVWQWAVLGAITVLIAKRFNGGAKPGVQTVTLTPNNANAVVDKKSPGLGTIADFLQSTGQDWQNFSFTLPDGSTFTLTGGVPHITPPPGGSPPVTPPAISPPASGGGPGVLPPIRPPGPTDPGAPTWLPGGILPPGWVAQTPGSTPPGGRNPPPTWWHPPANPPATPPLPGLRGGSRLPGSPSPIPYLR